MALAHFHHAGLHGTGLLQGGLDAGKVGGLGHQGTEPVHLLAHLRALTDQLVDEAYFAAFAPEFIALAAKVEHRQLALGVGLAQCSPFALAAAGSFLQGGMEGRVAQRYVEAFIGLQQAQQDVLAVALLAQADGFAKSIGLDNGLG
ncbi:hypothetical protein D3C80_1248960 [compost metagenome]